MSMTLDEAFNLLEIDWNATDADVKEQYRWLVKFYHPDNTVSGNRHELVRIIEAYKTVISLKGFQL